MDDRESELKRTESEEECNNFKKAVKNRLIPNWLSFSLSPNSYFIAKSCFKKYKEVRH